jgi:hypothetical protein
MTEQQAERLVCAVEALTEHMAMVAQSNAMLIKAISEADVEQDGSQLPEGSSPTGTLDP